MLTRRAAVMAALAAPAGVGAASAPRRSTEVLIAEVRAAETAFARTMADRNLEAFARFVAEEAIFVNGGAPLRGRRAVVDHWRRYFAGEQAPFSWKPELVEVLESGTLAYSEGPVAGPDGVARSRYFSTWRWADGRWQVVFDNGYRLCEPPAAG